MLAYLFIYFQQFESPQSFQFVCTFILQMATIGTVVNPEPARLVRSLAVNIPTQVYIFHYHVRLVDC